MFHMWRAKLERRFADGRGLEKFSPEGTHSFGLDSKTLLSLLTAFLPLLLQGRFRKRILFRCHPVRAHVVGKTSDMILAVSYTAPIYK